jgi:hypothetical protein
MDKSIDRRRVPALAPRSRRIGLLAAGGLALFYVVVVAGASGSLGHLAEQARQDWYFLAFILGGFGLQVALAAELRRRHRLQQTAALAAGTGSGASVVGMVACCAHHLADLVPFIGATGAATFLLDYRIPFMVTGIGVNALGVAVAARRLRRTPLPVTPRGGQQWAHA